QRAREALEQARSPLLAARHLVARQAGAPRDLIDEFVVDQRPITQALDHATPDFRPARRVLARDRDERLYCCRRFRRRSPMFRIRTPPCVGTRITRLFDVFMSRSTSRYCRISASGVSVVFSSRCCSACSLATSTRWRSVSTCCSWAILALMAWTTVAGGCKARRKNALTVAMRIVEPPSRVFVTI